MKKKVLSVLIAGMLIVGLCGCTSSKTTSSNNQTKGTVASSSQAPTEKPTEASKAVTIGEFVQDEKWKVSFLSAKQTNEIKGEYMSTKASDGKTLLIMFFEVENISDEDDYFNYFYFNGYCDDTSVDQKAVLGDIDGNGTLTGDVAKGKKLKGCITYEVPADWKTFELDYVESQISSDNKMTFTVTTEQATK